MPTATVRYGRPKGSGLDDRQQLETIAALLAADPKLKPTTAIRSLGVDNPSVIRRLRDKFRHEQARLMANARRTSRPLVSSRPMPLSSNENTPVVHRPPQQAPAATAAAPVAPAAKPNVKVAPANALIVGWCDLAFSLVCSAADTQAALTLYWLQTPLVADATRRQLALVSYAVAIHGRSKIRRSGPHRKS